MWKVKTILAVVLLTLSGNIFASSSICKGFTPEQQGLIFAAYYKGKEKDLGYTLAAIVWKESFVSNWVITVNTEGENDSYGITHIELKTAMWLLGETNRWKARAEIIPRLMMDNNFAMNLALKKLHSLRRHPWRVQVQRYNGNGTEYGKDIVKKVKQLMSCYSFEEELEYENQSKYQV